MHDSYDIADLCRELEAKRKAVAVRTGVFTLFLGGAYILIGCFVWEQMAAPWPPERPAIAYLVVLAAWPFLLAAGFDKINLRLLTRWPRCPVCRKKLVFFQPVSRRCPECHNVIVYDRRKLLPRYTLPPEAMRIRNPNQPGISIGLEVGQLLLMVIVCIPALVVGFFLFPEDGGMDVESPRLAACFVMALGVFVILYRFIGVVGVEKLLELAAWLDRKCDTEREQERLAQLQEASALAQVEADQKNKEAAAAEKKAAQARAKLDDVAPLLKGMEKLAADFSDDSERTLPEAGPLESAKSYREKKAKPLWEKIVKVLRSVYRAYFDLKSRFERLQSAYDREVSKNGSLSTRIYEVCAERDGLKGQVRDYERVRRAIGPEQADKILEAVYQQEQAEKERKRAARPKMRVGAR